MTVQSVLLLRYICEEETLEGDCSVLGARDNDSDGTPRSYTSELSSAWMK